MIDRETPALLEKLRRAGLSRYESAVYLGLVQDRTARVAEISRRTGVPQPKVYQALESLVEKGFCTLGSAAIHRYRPIAPRVALAARLTQLKDEQKEVEELTGELEQLFAAGAQDRLWAPPIEIVKGMSEIRRMLVERIQEARRTILYFGQAPQVPALEVAQALWERAKAGVALRLIFERDYFEQGSERGEEDDLLLSLPGERRWAEELPTKMLIADESVALLSIAKPGSESFLVLALRQEGLVAHCRASFEHAWERARGE
jgi:sugar-specific transcriptional regulator TrmB